MQAGHAGAATAGGYGGRRHSPGSAAQSMGTGRPAALRGQRLVGRRLWGCGHSGSSQAHLLPCALVGHRPPPSSADVQVPPLPGLTCRLPPAWQACSRPASMSMTAGERGRIRWAWSPGGRAGCGMATAAAQPVNARLGGGVGTGGDDGGGGGTGGGSGGDDGGGREPPAPPAARTSVAAQYSSKPHWHPRLPQVPNINGSQAHTSGGSLVTLGVWLP